MPNLQTKSYGTGAFDWLLNTDGLDEAITVQIDISTFTPATHFPDGYLRSGTPVRVDDRDVVRPWADVAGAVLGFLKGDHKTDGVEDLNGAVIVRGNIKPGKLPVAFAAPVTAPQPSFKIWSS